MRIQHSSSINTTGLFILVLVYLFLLALIVFFSQHIIANVTNTKSIATQLGIIIILVLPLVLLGAIIYNVGKLIRERTRKKAGSRLKTRLLVFFAFVSSLAIVPQALISISFINSALNFWFSTRIGDALEGGLNISLEYYANKIDNLKSYSNSLILQTYLKDLPRSPEKVWQNISQSNPEINLFQVFDEKGNERIFKGIRKGVLSDINLLNKQFREKIPHKEVKDDYTILRVLLKPTYQGKTWNAILGITFPKKFDEYASQITKSNQIFQQLFEYKHLFRSVVVIFYFLFSIPILLLSILVSFLLTEEIIRPIVNLEEATKRVIEGDFSYRILTRTHDELAVLANSFNKMISELDNSRRKLIQAEKISAWKHIAQRLAHEIKNPLTPIKLSAQRILKKFHTEPENLGNILEQAISSIITEVENLNKLLDEFREFTKLPDPSPQVTNIKKIIAEVLVVYQNMAPAIQIDCYYHDPALQMFIDPNQMKQVFANLLKNAIQAISGPGKITITSSLVKKDETNYLRIQIKDTGCGMSDEVKEKLFDPYFTTKKDGSGLGLAIVERIIFDHNGSIWFETEQGNGTTFFIDLPLRETNG